MDEINYEIDDMSIDDNIELLINEFKLGANKLQKEYLKKKYYTSKFPLHLSIEKLKIFKIIEEIDSEYLLQYEGYELLKLGSWKNYLENLAKLKAEQHEMVKSVISTNRNQRIVLWLTIGISLVSMVISILTFFKEEIISLNEPIKVTILDTLNSKVTKISPNEINDSLMILKHNK